MRIPIIVSHACFPNIRNYPRNLPSCFRIICFEVDHWRKTETTGHTVRNLICCADGVADAMAETYGPSEERREKSRVACEKEFCPNRGIFRVDFGLR